MMFSVAMNGSSRHDAGTDDLRVDDQPVGDVQQDVQDGVSSQEALGHRNALVGGVVQRALKPLGTGGDGGVQHVRPSGSGSAQQMRSQRMGLRL